MLEPTFKVFRLGAGSGAPVMAHHFSAARMAAPHISCPTQRRVSPSARSAELVGGST